MAEGGGRGGNDEVRRGIPARRPLFHDDLCDKFDDEGGRPQSWRNRSPHRRQPNIDRNVDRNGQRQPNEDIDTGGRGNPGPRKRKPLVVGVTFLKNLETREPSDILLTLGNPNTDFQGALRTSGDNRDILILLLSVLAKAVTCNSLTQELNIVFTMMKEQSFFETVTNYFLEMINEDSPQRHTAFKKPIKDMILIMSEIISKNPTSVTETLGVHQILQTVIDGLMEKSTVIDNDITTSFRELTDHKEKLLIKIKRRTLSKEDKDLEHDLDSPPDDFRDIEIFPQTADMQMQDDRYLRANKVKGRYLNLDHYLDVQFRLLREDFIGPLRDGVSEYVEATRKDGKKKEFQDIRLYQNVRIVAPTCGDTGICHLLQFDVTRLRNVHWRSTKRLIYGSLLCLSPDNFRTFYFSTIVDRKPEDLEKGLVTVRFEHVHADVNGLFGSNFTMAETTAYFEAYRHVLVGLKNFYQGDLPFEKYIISCENQVSAPAYLRRNQGCLFDLRPLIDEDVVLNADTTGLLEMLRVRKPAIAFSERSKPAKAVEILNRESWPPADLLHLDESQFRAIHTALTKEFVIMQGPPGTGKTYMGLKIVKALLHNKEVWSTHPATGKQDVRPMLIVCYTNHALDQFLEGIIKFYKSNVIRVGGRSSSEALKNINLNNFRHQFRHARKIPVAVYYGRRNARDEMDSHFSQIIKISLAIQYASTTILYEDYLACFMMKHYQLLLNQFQEMLRQHPETTAIMNRKGFSVIVEWLGLGNLAQIIEVEGNAHPVNEQQQIDGQFIDVEEEADFIQEQRQLDNEDDEIYIDDDDMWTLTRREKKELIITHAKRVERMAVALDVEHMEKKPRDMEIGDWQTQKQQRKKMKRNVQRNLCSLDIMSEEEAERVHDMIRLPMPDKWRLYRLWIKRYCDFYLRQIDDKQGEYEAAAERYKEALMQEDKAILKCSTVIGMTTTGAARYQAILKEIGPRIIVVEEAAEVLEAHIITTLSKSCEQLILIGDHKQLKPSPTVYNLATDYNMDISLFERMVINNLRCDCLELQHRMRPEIAQLMLHIYDSYKNHNDVTLYESIKGIHTNIFFVNHNNLESHDEDKRSHSNDFEARYAVALCKYLLLQGYTPEQITVLTMYSGQLFALTNNMPKTQFEGVKVTVVDNYQGEENDIIILSLVRSNEDGNIGFLKIDNRVCVALSRAKKGFYVIGNFDLLSKCGKSQLWRKIVTDMKKKNMLGDGLKLYCQNHPDEDGIVAREAKDFEKAPEGGCDKKCDFRLPCGHACEMFCHVIDQEHKDYMCEKICKKPICKEEGHRCKKKCYQECGVCEELVDKKIPKCGHTQKVPCYLKPEEFACKENCRVVLNCGHLCKSPCGNAHTSECLITVEKSWPCGHSGEIACYQKNEAPCIKPCEEILACKHRCTGTCVRCFNGRLHCPCVYDCSRILVCGHECKGICNRCPSCTRTCENRCVHSKCKHACGELCQPCTEQCPWQCEHFKCENRCSEPCNRQRCNQPCKRILDCTHPCIGLCGEPCPTDCRICDKQKVTEIFFGNESKPEAHFVLMEDCKRKCIIESAAMDIYMDSVQKKGQEIMLKSCPKCKTTIRKSRRYGSIINKTLQDIEDVKEKVMSGKMKVLQLEDEIKTMVEEGLSKCIKLALLSRLRKISDPKTEQSLVALKNQVTILKRLKIVETEWKKIRSVVYSDEIIKMLKFLSNFEEWAMINRSIMTSQETDDGECELARSEHKLRLMRHKQCWTERDTEIDTKLRSQMREMEIILHSDKKYKEHQRDAVEAYLKELKKVVPLSGLGIREIEREMFFQAINLPCSHWFKCPKGHVYAIGESGGAIVEGMCPECNATIGGTGHRMRTDNQLTGEMDGAQNQALNRLT